MQVLPGLEPGLQGSEPWVLTNYTIEPSSIERQWCIGNIEASQALAPGDVFLGGATKVQNSAYWRD